MKHCIATVCLSGLLPEKIYAAAAAGFDGIELFENDLLYYDGTPQHVAQMCREAGLEMMLFQPFRDFEGNPRAELPKHLDRLKKKFDLMQELGADTVLLCSNTRPDADGDIRVITDDLLLAVEEAAKQGIRIGYEALAWGTRINSYRQVWEIVREAAHPNLGVILDSFHTMSLNDDLSGLLHIPAEKIFFIQMADAPLMRTDVLTWSRHYRNFPGQGEFNLPAFLAPVLAAGYNGPLSLEVFNDGFRSAPPMQTAAYAKKSLCYLEERTKNHLAYTFTQPAEPLFSPPAVPQYRDTAFLEFAADAESGKELSDWLLKLGFVKTGRHKSKDVALYEQGEASLIVNMEPDSFSRHFFLKNGVSLCAAAFAVTEAENALARAKAYGFNTYDDGKRGADEEFIPAIFAPDGSLQYFVDKTADIRKTDFDTCAANDARLVNRIDHFALGIAPESADIWSLHFKSVFGFAVDHEVVLPNSFGLLKSRVAHSLDRTVRIPLNITEGRDAADGGAAPHRFGLQHLALAAADIFSTVSVLEANGARLLQIPDNYYEDLEARYSLPADFVARMKANNILYDEDGKGGSLLHVYTEPFRQSFFFEILERRNGYDSYGAVNAPVRIAALGRVGRSDGM